MKIHRAYKFRLYPNQVQQALLDKTFGCCRFLWNQMLHERSETYHQLKDDKDKLYCHKYKTEKEYKQEYSFLKEVDAKALQSSTNNLLTAFQNFFEGLKEPRKVGYPRFKSRKNKQSYTTYNINNNTKIDFETKRIKLPKIKTWIKYRDERIFDEPIKHVTVSKTKSGKYYIAILVEKQIDISPKTEINQDKIQAFDMSFLKFLVSNQNEFENPRFYRIEEKTLKKLHRQVSRKKKGSNNRYKARIRLARKYERIYNRKNDWTHKISRDLSILHDAIILEDLNIEGMKKLGKGHVKSVTLDFSWYQFVSTLKYKLEQQGKHLILVDRWFPSSKQCSTCGWKNDELKLSDRKWTCQTCGIIHERDKNASRNLLDEGMKQLNSLNMTIIPTVGTTGSHA
ncbi:MAG: RNA-guided endonuclease TnpB family protein [Promethearchaeota archaeon]